jgi:hypothetical protein
LSSTALRYMDTSEGQLQAHQDLRAAKRAIRFLKVQGSNFEWDSWDDGAIAFHTTLVVKKSPNTKTKVPSNQVVPCVPRNAGFATP